MITYQFFMIAYEICLGISLHFDSCHTNTYIYFIMCSPLPFIQYFPFSLMFIQHMSFLSMFLQYFSFLFSLFPFGAGRRACMGENLALERMFLYATCLIQRFQFLPPDGYHQSCDPRDFQLGLILEPKEFFIRIYTRKRLTDQTSLNYEIDTDSGSNVSDVE